MLNTNRVAEIAALMGDPARASILLALMDGRALTAGELARAAGITPQTASGHLTKLTTAGLLAMERQGRHRYHRLAARDVAGVLENLSQMATRDMEMQPLKTPRTGPRDNDMRFARTCYDHFAGNLGVAITDGLLARSWIAFEDDAGLITPEGLTGLEALGIELPNKGKTKRSARPLCRPCLDWSERRPHVAGALGAAVCSHYLNKGYVRRRENSRSIEITRKGEAALFEMFGVRL